MVDPAASPATPQRAASASLFIATIVGIVALVLVALSFDLFLAGIDRRESAAHAANEYADGLRLLHDKKPLEAIEQFEAAVATDRTNVSYALGLGEALLQTGRVADADATLRALLDRAENDGAVNLVMAHVLVREGRDADAIAYYHRAVFGRWGADSVARRIEARFELIDLLARGGDARALLAELLPFEEVSPDSVALRRRLGQLFLRAGSPVRATAMFRDVLRRDANDADAHVGMGEAALALGNFRAARADFAEAERLRPGDTLVAARRVLTDTVLALDPTARGLSAGARQPRSRTLLARTLQVVTACPGPRPALGDSARALLARYASGRVSDAASDAMLGVAADLWAARPATCDAAQRDEPLRRVQARLAQ